MLSIPNPLNRHFPCPSRSVSLLRAGHSCVSKSVILVIRDNHSCLSDPVILIPSKTVTLALSSQSLQFSPRRSSLFLQIRSSYLSKSVTHIYPSQSFVFIHVSRSYLSGQSPLFTRASLFHLSRSTILAYPNQALLRPSQSPLCIQVCHSNLSWTCILAYPSQSSLFIRNNPSHSPRPVILIYPR